MRHSPQATCVAYLESTVHGTLPTKAAAEHGIEVSCTGANRDTTVGLSMYEAR